MVDLDVIWECGLQTQLTTTADFSVSNEGSSRPLVRDIEYDDISWEASKASEIHGKARRCRTSVCVGRRCSVLRHNYVHAAEVTLA